MRHSENSKNKWSPKELQVISLLATDLGKNLSEIASQVGIHRETLRRWRQNPDFCDAVWNLAVQASRARLGAVLTAVTDAACSHPANEKNVRAAELILNFHGKWSPKMEIIEKRPQDMSMAELLAKLPEKMREAIINSMGVSSSPADRPKKPEGQE